MNRLLGNLRGAPDRAVALESYRSLVDRYDVTCRAVERLRLAAIEALAPQPGETVYDVACGTGVLLPELARRVGGRGRVIGIEQSPEMARLAMTRFPAARLPANVELLVAPVEHARPDPRADALLFCYTHDVLQAPRALDNVLALARPAARVAALGLNLLPWWWGAPVNAWKLWSGRHYLTTYRGLRSPWRLLAERVEALRVIRRFHFGTNYLAVGRTRAVPDGPGSMPGLARLNECRIVESKRAGSVLPHGDQK